MNVGWVDDSSDGSVESSGGMENEIDGCAWRAHPTALNLPTATAVAPQSIGDGGQSPSESSLTASGQ